MELKLVVVEGPGTGVEVALDERVVIGRSDLADLRLDSARASRTHAAIEPAAGLPELEDLGSSNGTLLNGEPLGEPRPLSRGDSIEIGDSLLRVVAIDPTTEETILAAAVPDDPEPTVALDPDDEADEETVPTAALDTAEVDPEADTAETAKLEPGSPPDSQSEPLPPPVTTPMPPPAPPPPPRRRPYRPPPEPAPPPPRPSRAFNWQAASALALGVLALLLVFSATPDLFFAAPAAAIAAIALGSQGKRRSDEGTATALRPAALAGQLCGIVALVLSVILIAIVLAVNALTETGLDSFFDLVDEADRDLADEVWQRIRESF